MKKFHSIAMFLLTLLIVFVSTVSAQNNMFYASKCPKFIPMKNFKFESYATGVWYEAYRYPNDLETSKKCVRSNFSFEGEILYIEKVGVPNNCTSYTLIVGIISPEAKGTANCTAIWTFQTPRLAAVFQRYILDTDYTSYAIVAGCRYIKEMNKYRVYAWIDIRDNIYQGKAEYAVEKYLNYTSVINRDMFIKINNSGKACKPQSYN